MIDGVLYTTVGITRNVVALDPTSGETLWVWRPNDGEQRFKAAPRKTSGRGLSYWKDGAGTERLFVVTPGFYLVSLDPGTGRQTPGFGENGVVDLMVGIRGEMTDKRSIGNSSPALVIGDVVSWVRARRRHAARDKENIKGGRARLRRAHGQAAVDFPHDSRERRAGLRDVARRLRRVTPATRASGRGCRPTPSSAWSTCRWRRRSATSTAATGPAAISTATASCASTRRPARRSGTTS